MNKIKMVITDLDGTFLNNEEIVSQRNIQAIKKLKESGILFGFATGRPICSVENLIPKWQMDGVVDFIIGLNGGHIKDYRLQKEERYFQIDGDIIKDIIKHFHDMPVNFGIYDENYLAVLKNDYLAQRLAKSDDIPYQVVDFEELLKHQQSKLIVICDPKDMPTIVKHGQLFSHPAVKSLQAGKIEYEYMHPKLSKSHGINMLCTWNQIKIENICAFGDADNDADMIHDVRIGIAMENASPLTKSYAKAITLDNQNDGVAEYIEKFILGEEK